MQIGRDHLSIMATLHTHTCRSLWSDHFTKVLPYDYKHSTVTNWVHWPTCTPWIAEGTWRVPEHPSYRPREGEEDKLQVQGKKQRTHEVHDEEIVSSASRYLVLNSSKPNTLPVQKNPRERLRILKESPRDLSDTLLDWISSKLLGELLGKRCLLCLL